MKEIHLEQGSDNWLAWRAGKAYTDLFGAANSALDGLRITATAASVCGGDSPFSTPHQLYCKTLGLTTEKAGAVDNYIMARGNALEPKARAAYMKLVGFEVEPLCIESSTTPWIAASLDGSDIFRSKGVEIKCPISERIHEMAMNGEVPSYYADQIQWQFLASDNQISSIDFYSYAPKFGKAAPITVYPDLQRQAELLSAARLFRMAVLTRTPLAGSEFAQAAANFLVLNRQVKSLTAKLEEAKDAIKKLASGKAVQGGGIMVTVANSDGRVSWEAVAMELVNRLSLSEDDLTSIKESNKGKPTTTISVKEAPDADGVLAEIHEKMKLTVKMADEVSFAEKSVDDVVAPVPNW